MINSSCFYKYKYEEGQLKPIVLYLLIAVGIGAITLIMGCDETQTMVKPVIEDITVKPDEMPEMTKVADMKTEAATEETAAASTETAKDETQEAKPEESKVVETPRVQVDETSEEQEVAETVEAPTIDMPVEPSVEPEEMLPPVVMEIGYYSDWNLTRPLDEGTVFADETVFTKIIFSDEVPFEPADHSSARPNIRYIIDGRHRQFDILRGFGQSSIRDGDCQPIEGTKVFRCRVDIPSRSSGEFSVYVRRDPFESEPLTIKAPRTPLEREVEVVEVAGLVDNSPLVRAVQATNRISDRINALLITGWRASFNWRTRNIDRLLTTAQIDSLRADLSVIFSEEAGLEREKVWDEIFYLPTIYNESRPPGGEPHVYGASSGYWMVIEYLRIKYENPGIGLESARAQFRTAVEQGRISLDFRTEKSLFF